MRVRSDNSIQSSNFPSWLNVGLKEDYALYRCMITKVFYTDDSRNFTQNAQNPEVIYQVVILGGFKQGQLLSNVRISSFFAGDTSYWERTLKPTTKDLRQDALQNHDGDIVYVQFVQGHQGYPVIVALGKGLHDQNGTSSTNAPRSVKSYNGVTELIDNQGQYYLTRNGGTLDSSGPSFTPGTSLDSQISLLSNQVVKITTSSGTTLQVDGRNSNITITTGNTNVTVDDKNKKITLSSGSTQVIIDSSSGKITLSSQNIDLGASVSDMVTQFTQLASQFAMHTHIGNMGSPTSPPQAPLPSSVGSQTVKVQS